MIVKKWFWILPFFFLLMGNLNIYGESLQSFDAQIQVNESTPSTNDNYFDLQLKPGQESTLNVLVTNLKETEITIIPSFNRAKTNQLGVVEYSGRNQDRPNNLPIDIEKIVSVDKQKFTLAGHEQKKIPLTIKMPEKDFDGVIAGGLYLQEEPKKDIQGNIQHVFSREIAVLLKTQLNKIQPNLELKKAAPTQINQRNAIKATLENTNAAYLSSARIHYEIKKEQQQTPVLTGTQPISFAPNSGTDYLIFLEGKEFEPGTYQLMTNVKNKEINWQQKINFTISQKTAATYNEQNISTKKDEPQNNWLLWLAGGIIFALVLIIVFLLYIVKKKKR
ncbi:DUF916 and DUF3324 domain-containing protein [Enterococcus hirae]